jgi:hypothetical protein
MKRIVILAVAMALMVPGIAFGANPTCNAYNPQLCGSVTPGTVTTGSTSPGSTSPGSTSPGTGATESQASSGTLPFTGLDAGLVVAAGVMLLGSGFVVRRLSRRLN